MNSSRWSARILQSDSFPEDFGRACASAGVPGGAIALVDDGVDVSASCGTDEAGVPCTRHTEFDVRCVVRPLVGAFFAALADARRLALDDEASLHLPRCSEQLRAFLGRTSLRHLLSQTDGIGYRAFDHAPCDGRGFIDLPALERLVLAEHRDALPGRYYSTSLSGFALLGCILERYFEQPVADLLRQQLIAYLRQDGSPATQDEHTPGAPICPGSGHGLNLTVAILSRFIQFQFSPSTFAPAFRAVSGFSEMYEPVVGYPGWSAGMTGSCLAWKNFSGGWIGQNGVADRHTVVVRLHPVRRSGFAAVIRANLPTSYGVLGRLLSQELPEFSSRPEDRPRLLSPGETAALKLNSFIGEFGNRYRRFVISTDADSLVAQRRETDDQERASEGRCALLPATSNIFFTRSPDLLGAWFLQFLPAGPTQERDMLWDGWFTWPRMGQVIQR